MFPRKLLKIAVERAGRSPFFAHKLKEAGMTPEKATDYSAWKNIPLTTKEELRRMTPEEFYREVCIAKPEEVADFWRSGGVTGEPFFYPRTKEDMVAGVESFRRCLDLTGVSSHDVVHISFPIGIHPVGHVFCLAVREQGSALVWAGSGANTPSEVQVRLIHLLETTVLLSMASYAVHLAHVAASLKYDLARCKIGKILSCAEHITPAKRAKVQEMWQAKLYDSYGMSEMGMMGCECDEGDGYHLWSDMYFVEILDERSWEPLKEGEFGQVVVTPLWNNNATPFVRWLSGDIASILPECKCQGPFSIFPLFKFGGRTTGFLKIKGVNINHSELEDLLLSIPGVADYRVTATEDDSLEVLLIEVEVEGETLEAKVEQEVLRKFGIRPRGTISKDLESAVKQVRFFDKRGRS